VTFSPTHYYLLKFIGNCNFWWAPLIYSLDLKGNPNYDSNKFKKWRKY